MFNNIALDVFIGLIAIFLLYSLLASILMEALAKRLGLRARMTQKAISKLLDNTEFTDEILIKRAIKSVYGTRYINSFKGRPLTALFYAHPNIKSLGKDNLYRKPSDISAELFSDTFIQLLRGDKFNGQQNQLELINENLKLGTNSEGTITLPVWYTSQNKSKLWEDQINGNKIGATTLTIQPLTTHQLKQFLFDSHSDIGLFKERLITWYNEMMDRATGWYIKQTRIMLFIIGFILALGFNVDSIAISAKLAKDKTVRDKMIEFAGKTKNDTPRNNATGNDFSTAAANKAFEEAYKNITEVNQVIGNTLSCKTTNGYSFFGWLITAFAISLGAPFWFDLLKKIMSVRQAGKGADESATNKSKGIASVSSKDRVG